MLYQCVLYPFEILKILKYVLLRHASLFYNLAKSPSASINNKNSNSKRCFVFIVR